MEASRFPPNRRRNADETQLVERELTDPKGPRRGRGGAEWQAQRDRESGGKRRCPGCTRAGTFDDRLFDAGRAVALDYEKAQLSAVVTMRWDPVRVEAQEAVGTGSRQASGRLRQSALRWCDGGGRAGAE